MYYQYIDLRNHCNIFWVDAGIHSKNGGKTAWCISFPSVFGVDTCINPKNITTIPYHFISTLLNVNFDFDVTVANDVAIDIAKCSFPGKLMQWLPCPEVRTLTNENGHYMIKLNDTNFQRFYPQVTKCWGIKHKKLSYFRIFLITHCVLKKGEIWSVWKASKLYILGKGLIKQAF